MQYPNEIVRLRVDVTNNSSIEDVFSEGTPAIWRGNDVEFQIGIFKGEVPMDASVYTQIILEVLETTRLGNALMKHQAPAVDITGTFTLEQWEAGTHQHCIIRFNAAETDLDLGGVGKLEKSFWLVISALTSHTPARRVTLGGGEFKIQEDGTSSGTLGTPPPGSNQVTPGAVYAEADRGAAAGEYLVPVRDGGTVKIDLGATDNAFNNNGLGYSNTLSADGQYDCNAYRVVAASTEADVFDSGLGGETIFELDGRTLVQDDIFLLKNCDSKRLNGLYRITDGDGHFAAISLNGWLKGFTVKVENGGQAGTYWRIAASVPTDSEPDLSLSDVEFEASAEGYTHILLLGDVGELVQAVVQYPAYYTADESDARFAKTTDVMENTTRLDELEPRVDTLETLQAATYTLADGASDLAEAASTAALAASDAAAAAQATADAATVTADAALPNTEDDVMTAIEPLLVGTSSISITRGGDVNESRHVIAALGDGGYDNADAAAVESMVKGERPDDIILLGDNSYPTANTTALLDQNVGRKWRPYIYPFLGNPDDAPLGDGEVDATENHLWPVWGNHDWGNSVPNPNGLNASLAYHTLPGNERYYSVRFGDLEIFILDDDDNEPDGNEVGSVQYNWLVAAVAASTARFKGVAHHKPWSESGSRHAPNEKMNWDWVTIGIQFVMSGHEHNYERWVEGGVVRFTVGTGGADLNGFSGTQPANSFARIQQHGALFIRHNAYSVIFEFRNKAGVVLDTYELTGASTDGLHFNVKFADDQLPKAVQVNAEGAVGSASEAARRDHEHPAPGLASADEHGFMSSADYELLQRLGGNIAVGFDNTVRALLVTADAIYAGGDFEKYGTVTSPRFAKMTRGGLLNSNFAIGTGFDQNVHFLAEAGDGDVMVGIPSMKAKYQGSETSQLVWKINVTGSADETWTTPDPIDGCACDDDTLIAIACTLTRVVLLTPRTFRALTLTGSNVATKLGTLSFNDVKHLSGELVFVSSTAYILGVGQDFDGQVDPKALKLIDVTTGADFDATFEGNAGVGSEAAVGRLAVASSYNQGAYVIGGNWLPKEGTDWSWDSGNLQLFEGFLKVMRRGDAPDIDVDGAEEMFDSHLELTANEGAAIPFCIDTAGRIYFGGPVTKIQNVDVTPWRLYRLTKSGGFQKAYQAFNGRVLCAALLSDDRIVVGGEFTQYGNQKVGRIVIMDPEGNITGGSSGFELGEDEGIIVTRDEAPDVATDPKQSKNLWRKPGDPSTLHIWNEGTLAWQSICDVCSIGGGGPGSLPGVTFSPVGGTQIPEGGSLEISLAVPGHTLDINGGTCEIYYVTTIDPNSSIDPTNPNATGRTKYTGPIEVSEPVQIRAYAVKAGFSDGQVSQGSYGLSAGGDIASGQWLLNTQMLAATATKVGPAAIGWDMVNQDDFWRSIFNNVTFTLKDADQNDTTVKAKLLLPGGSMNNFAHTGLPGAGDVLMRTCLASLHANNDGFDGTFSVQFEKLPSGCYSAYVYGRQQENKAYGRFSVRKDGTTLAGPSNTDSNAWIRLPWQAGRQYVKLDFEVQNQLDQNTAEIVVHQVTWDKLLTSGVQQQWRSSQLCGVQILKLKKLPKPITNHPTGTQAGVNLTAQILGAVGNGVQINYSMTTDGSEPGDPVTAMVQPLEIPNDASGNPVRLKIQAVKTDWTSSDILTLEFYTV